MRHRGEIVLLSATCALQGLAATSYQQPLPDVRAEFAAPWGVVAATVSGFSLATAAGHFATGPLVDRLGARRLLLPCLLLFTAGAVAAAHAGGVAALAAAGGAGCAPPDTKPTTHCNKSKLTAVAPGW